MTIKTEEAIWVLDGKLDIDAHQNEHVQGITDESTTSTTYVTMPDMTRTMDTGNNHVLCLFTASIQPTSGAHCYCRLRIDGDSGVKTYNPTYYTGGYNSLTLMYIERLSVGSHTIDIQWRVTAGTAYNWASTFDMRRSLIVIELKR